MYPENIVRILEHNLADQLFPSTRRLVPNIDDVYELEIAFYENMLLTDEELLKNSAYFSRIAHTYTRHFLMCVGDSLKLPHHSSSRLKSFFEKNLFRTGYATHGLFPYRGKFHPQMIKGLLNIMGIKPGETVLDPMMGSGTVLVEACLMGINSVGIDASPFCQFMTKTKLDALTMSLTRARKALDNHEDVFQYFHNQGGQLKSHSQLPGVPTSTLPLMPKAANPALDDRSSQLSARDRETLDTHNLLLLAYLDSAGYAERSNRKSPLDHFRTILERYLFVVEKIQHALSGLKFELGSYEAKVGDSRELPLQNESVDGIIFSPPYSFAIDYLKNDSFHLNYLGVDLETLSPTMVGLRGRTLRKKFENYQQDMGRILSECARVLRHGRLCTIIIGTNSNQLAKVLRVPPEEVPGLHQLLIDLGARNDLHLVKLMSRPITGISNTMRREYIVMLRRGIGIH